MVDVATLLTVLVAAFASLFMAWAIGAGSSGSTPFAPAVGANAISVMRAGFFVGLLGFLGAVLQGQNVSETMGRDLIGGVTLTGEGAAIALIAAGGLVAIGVFTGYPIATAFTATGAVIGVGLALGGDPAWAQYQQIAALWILTPFVGGAIAYGTARVLRYEGIADRTSVPLCAGVIGALVANLEFALLGPDDGAGTIAGSISASLDVGPVAGVDAVSILTTLAIAAACTAALYREMGHDVERGERRFLLVLGGLVAFSAGGSQVGLAIGPLLPLLDPYEISVTAVLVGGGLGLLAGSWTGAPRMIKAIAQDYSSLGPRRSIAALIPSFMIAQTAVLFGIPVSFNEIIVSAVVGAGAAASTGGAGVSKSKMGYTVLAWAGSLALSLALGYGVMTLVSLVL
ncbi:inorganic phosphate transporter [Halalkalicoccus tibetensis]|uniref:Phosphate transporter n=1 Tax=Halalkalicoccus tibetensis TaxID=175632 RepID=A0ABD5V805_9EURY